MRIYGGCDFFTTLMAGGGKTRSDIFLGTCAAAAAATVQLKPGVGVTVETDEEEMVQSRAEQIDALPEFGEVTGLTAE